MNNSDLFFSFFLREHSQGCGKSHEFMTQLWPPKSEVFEGTVAPEA